MESEMWSFGYCGLFLQHYIACVKSVRFLQASGYFCNEKETNDISIIHVIQDGIMKMYMEDKKRRKTQNILKISKQHTII
mmetsp:Transcript_9267/g.13683  ORF Transcript_9267/g.13683 Transcript_9267/m.13683 type:complete len:80 (-) Transcript_9267:302-541(-)